LSFSTFGKWHDCCRLRPHNSKRCEKFEVMNSAANNVNLNFSLNCSNEIITDTLASTPEIPIEQLSPAKHAQDLYASLINSDPVNDGSCKY
jgi:hypothetical protein